MQPENPWVPKLPKLSGKWVKDEGSAAELTDRGFVNADGLWRYDQASENADENEDEIVGNPLNLN